MPRVDAFSSKMKKTNILFTAREVIYNKYVLYVVFLAALFDLLYSAVKQDYMYCVLFILVGFIMAFFNKNMTVILTLTMAVANILKSVIGGKSMSLEGFSEEEPEEEKESMSISTAKPAKPKTTPASTPKTEMLSVPSSTTKPSIAKTSPSVLVDNLKDQAIDLQELQQKIIQGFEQIEPHMNKAESLIGSIQETALTIQGMREKQTA
jgi:hypothetical protein